MSYKHANRRYLLTVMVATLIFLVSSLAIKWADNSLQLALPLLWLVCAVPVLALLATLWAHWRYITEIDEFLRSIQIKAIFVGLTVVLVLVSSWGYLESYAHAPQLPIFWINPIYWFGYGAGAIFFSLREGVEI